MSHRFDRGDIVEILKIIAVVLILFLIFGGSFLIPKEDRPITTVANISVCTYQNNEFKYVKQLIVDSDVYICGKTNKPSESFELILYEEKSGIVYADDITASPEKVIQYHIEYDFSPGNYIVEINGLRKTFAKSEFEVIKK